MQNPILPFAALVAIDLFAQVFGQMQQHVLLQGLSIAELAMTFRTGERPLIDRHVVLHDVVFELHRAGQRFAAGRALQDVRLQVASHVQNQRTLLKVFSVATDDVARAGVRILVVVVQHGDVLEGLVGSDGGIR